MDKLLNLLNELESPGTFSAAGTLPSILPGLEINNVGEISLPLNPEQAEKIIAQCEQAPFGLKEQTIVDTEVRNVWQLSPSAFQLQNPDWATAINKLCEQISQQLGLGEVAIESELYKLLLYGKGCFFTSHRDTEKMDNMFATLVISLPSTHEGGELIISHAGECHQYSFAGKKYSPEYAVFYADCFHEVKPIISGYRLCLVYNLAIAGRNTQPKLSQFNELSDQINSCIQQWAQAKKEHPFLTCLLEHSYSEKNLSLTTLKSSDFTKASILLQAAARHHCKGYLCLVSYLEESYGEYHGGYYGRRRSYRDNDDECSESNYDEYGINKQEIYAHNLLDGNSNEIRLEKIILSEEQLLADEPLIGGPGREVSISEATGNEGATKELWYHRGAVIIWPESAELEVIAKSDLKYAIYCLETRLKSHLWQGDEIQKAEIVSLAQHILDRLTWSDFKEFSSLFDELTQLGNIEILKSYLQKCTVSYFHSLEAQAAAKLIKQFSFATFKDQFDAVINKLNGKLLPWLRDLYRALENCTEKNAVVTGYFTKAWQEHFKQRLEAQNQETLIEIFIILAMLNDQQLLQEACSNLSSCTKPSFVSTVFAPALIKTWQISSSSERNGLLLLNKAFSQGLNKFFSAPPEKPTTWYREGKSNCECLFCQQFNSFLSDREQSSLTIAKTLKYNLQHIEEAIIKNNIDVQLEIIRDKSKFTGIYTKNEASYQAALNQFQTAHKYKQQLEQLTR